MGLRSAFNPLGALPYAVTVSYSKVSWKVDGLTSNLYPSSWILSDGTSSVVVGASSVQASESTVDDALVVTFSCDIPSGLSTVTNVDVNDDNYSES